MEKRLKVTLKWYFYFFTFAAFVFQADHGAHSAMAGGSVCCNTTSSILYVVNQEVTDEVTIQAVASFMRRTYHRLNSTGQSTQAAIAMIFQLFRERQSCWGMSFEPRDTMEEDIKQIQYYGKFSKDCNKAYRKNVESMKTSLLGSSGLDPADRLFVFIIDLDLPLDFFRVNKGIDVKSFVIFTHWRFSKRRVLPEDFNFYYKNQEQLTIENILHFEGPRAFNRSVPDVVDDIYREDENVVHQALVTREEDTIARLRFDDTERNVTWAYGKDICARRGMYLLSPRTSFEADRVADTIMQMAGNKSQDAQLKRTEFNVYIGLRRSKTSHGHRFEWTEGSNTLFYSKWAEGEPTDMTECVYWQFRQNDNGTVENVGWRSGSCGAAVVVVSVCQARIYALRHPMRVPDNISPVNDSELYAKGNFIKVKVNDHITIMALSQAVASGRLQQLFRDVDYVDIGGLVSHEMVRIGSREKEILLAALDPLFHVCKRSRWSVSADRKRNGVSLAEVCDGRPQCFTRSDEYGCRGLGHANCTSKFFTCRSSECVPLQYKCDLVYDCADGSDEDDCEDSECKHMQCSDGTCLPKPWHTDGQQDCENADDAPQKLSGSKTKDVCLFTCQRNECINKQKLEDDTRDCVGPEGPLDVTLKPAGIVDCGLHFQRVSPKCVMVRDALGEVIGCRDLRHLMGCENFTCPDGYIKCPRSYCIPQGYMADGRDDCLRGEDEYKIERPDVSKHFLCSERNNQSVSIGGLCDGRQDCDRGEDEIDCDYIHIPGTISLAGAAAMFSFHRGQEAPKVENQTNFLAAIDERTRYLDLTGVHVPEFFQNFPEGRLRQLIVLILSNCGIHDVFRHARDIPGFCEHHFRIRDMNALRKIDLSHNNIRELPECSHFKLMKGLKHLNLSHNPNLSNLTRISFTDMSSLEELDISYIGVSELPTDLFDDLPNLQKLWIRGLRLDSFDAILPEKITYLNLEHIRVKMEAGIFQNIKDMREMRTSTFVRCCPTILAESNGSRIPPNNCHAPTDTLSSCTDLLRDTFQRSLLWTFGILAIVGNLLTVTYRVLWDRVTLMKPTGMFVTNLSISDLIIGVYLALISTADRALKGHYIQVENWWRDSVICRYLGLLANVASITSAWFILLLTVDQVQIIRYPRSKIRFSTRTASLAVLGTWLFGLAAVTPPMIAGVTDWEILGMNSMCLGLGFDSERVTGWSYAIAVYVFIIGGLYMATLIGQYSIYGLSRSTGRRFRRKMRLEKRETVERRILELSMARRVSRISMTNFLSFAGISLIDVMVWRGDKVSRLLYAWTLVLIFPINSALNPILYFYPILSKALDKIQIKSKLKKAAAKLSETTGSKKTNPLTAATSLDDDDDDDIDDLFMPYDDNELLELCCEDLELLQYILEDEMAGEGSDDSDSEEITREDIERLQTELRQLEAKLAEILNKSFENSESEDMNKCEENSEDEEMNKCLEYSQSEDMNKCEEKSEDKEIKKCLEYSQSEEMNKCEEKSEDEEIKKFKKKSEDEDLKKCLEYSESEDMNECEENSEDEEINKCQEKSESEDMNECEENSEDEEMNKCQEKSESEDMNECEENSEDEEMNKCQEKSESEDMNKFKEKSQDEDMNKCKEKGEDGDINNRKKK